MDEGVDGEVLLHRRGWDGCAPVKGQVDRREALREIERGVLYRKTEREGKEAGSLAATGLWVGGAHAMLRSARRRL